MITLILIFVLTGSICIGLLYINNTPEPLHTPSKEELLARKAKALLEIKRFPNKDFLIILSKKERIRRNALLIRKKRKIENTLLAIKKFNMENN